MRVYNRAHSNRIKTNLENPSFPLPFFIQKDEFFPPYFAGVSGTNGERSERKEGFKTSVSDGPVAQSVRALL